MNTIVLQAKHVEPKDYKDFVGYAGIWCEVTDGMFYSDLWQRKWKYNLISSANKKQAHHEGEESFVFPQIEAVAGKEGFMAGNVREHGTNLFHLFPLSSLFHMC